MVRSSWPSSTRVITGSSSDHNGSNALPPLVCPGLTSAATFPVELNPLHEPVLSLLSTSAVYSEHVFHLPFHEFTRVSFSTSFVFCLSYFLSFYRCIITATVSLPPPGPTPVSVSSQTRWAYTTVGTGWVRLSHAQLNAKSTSFITEGLGAYYPDIPVHKLLRTFFLMGSASS